MKAKTNRFEKIHKFIHEMHNILANPAMSCCRATQCQL